MHTFHQGWTPKLLAATAFEMREFVVETCAEAQASDANTNKYIRLAKERWTQNMKDMRPVRDVTGIHFGKTLCKIPTTLFNEVSGERGRPTKLRAWEYRKISLVCIKSL